MTRVYTKTARYTIACLCRAQQLDVEPPKDIYDLTTRPGVWALMDRAAKVMLRIDNRRLREKLAVIGRIANGGQS